MRNPREIARRVLDEELKVARKAFQAAKDARQVAGEFFDPVWKYRGRNLLFRPVHGAKTSRLEPVADKLARCYMAAAMTGKYKTGESLISKLTSFRYLAEIIGDDVDGWHLLTPAKLNVAKTIFKKGNRRSAYHRANALTRFVDYLNQLAHRIGGAEMRFIGRKLNWSHRLVNPTREGADVTSAEHAMRREKLYKPGLEIAIATARFQILDNPSLEPASGYDLIRLEPMVFALGFGLRIGEITSLGVEALQKSEGGLGFELRVAVEKGALPEAKEIPSMWEQPFRHACAYLVETCAAARKRAKEIEERGFKFVRKALEEHRRMNPLSAAKLSQLRAVSLDPNDHYMPAEFASCFGISEKDFGDDRRRYGKCIVDLPRVVAARVVLWVDERIERWDWSDFARPRFGRDLRLTLEDVVRAAGSSRSSGTKATWFANDLRKFLSRLKEAGYLNSNRRPCKSEAEKVRQRWQALRKQMLSHSGGGSCTAVDVNKFVAELAQRYKRALDAHFKESIDMDEGGKGFVARPRNDGRPQRLSDHLIVVWEGQFSGRGGMGILPKPLMRADIYNYLCTNGQKKTVFQRLNIVNDDGKPYSMSPHDIRRWLTTALRRAGVSETALDVWTGRTPGQTRQYDYRTGAERAAHAAEHLYLRPGSETNDFFGRKVRFWRSEGVAEGEVAVRIREKLRVFHFTPWGGCSKDLYTSPCKKGLSCLRGYGSERTCQYFHIDPADEESKKNIERMRDNYILQLEALDRDLMDIKAAVHNELNNAAMVDQHIMFMLDMVSGCDAALEDYARYDALAGRAHEE